MRSSIKTVMLIAIAVPALSGCQALFGRSRSLGEGVPDREPVERMAQVQVDAGRAALANGQYGAAISAYRNARLSPAHAAQAYNGMAIAYSYIGRPDLAERFFREAMAHDPADSRYGANLVRLQREQAAMALRNATRPEAAGLAPVRTAYLAGQGAVSAQPDRTARGFVRVELPKTRLVKVADREFRLELVQTGGAARAARAGRHPVRMARAYPVRIDLSAKKGRR